MAEIYEPVLDLDDFKKPKALIGWEGVALAIITILFGRPGFYPSIPELGMNIQRFRNALMSSIDVDELKATLIYQCSAVSEDLIRDGLTVRKTYNGNQGAVIISIPMSEESYTKQLVIGLKGDTDGVVYNYGLFDLNNVGGTN